MHDPEMGRESEKRGKRWKVRGSDDSGGRERDEGREAERRGNARRESVEQQTDLPELRSPRACWMSAFSLSRAHPTPPTQSRLWWGGPSRSVP